MASSLRQRASTDDTAREAAHLRALNLERVLAVAMDRKGPFTRAQLIDATGLSAPTVGSLTSQLIRAGLVEDLGAGPSRGGRRPVADGVQRALRLRGRHRHRADTDAAGGGRSPRRAAGPSIVPTHRAATPAARCCDLAHEISRR